MVATPPLLFSFFVFCWCGFLLVDTCSTHSSITSSTLNVFIQKSSTTESLQVFGSNSSIILITFNQTASQDESSWNVINQIGPTTDVHVYSSLLEEDTPEKDEFKRSVEHAMLMNGLNIRKLSYVTLMLTDCMIGNPFVDNKQIKFLITTDFDLPIMVRKIRENFALGRLLEMSDFRIQVLAPYEIQYSTTSNISESTESLYQDKIAECLNAMKNCKNNGTLSTCYWKHDYCWIRQPSSLFQVQQFNLLNSYTNMKLVYNSSSISNSISKYSLEFSHETQNLTLPFIIYNEILPSFFFSCKSPICLYEPMLPSEPFHYAVAFCCLIFYIGLIFMRNKNTIKVRLLLPWICPLIVTIRILSSGEYLYSTCPIIYSMISIETVSIVVTIYCVTVIRFFYLRNLYDIISKSKRITLLKRLASVRFGIFVTVLASVIVFALLMVFLPMFIKIYLNQTAISVSRNVIIGVIVAIAIILAIIYSIFDIILRRKDIRMKGIMYYLFFDDPYLIRIDLISLIIILLLLIPFVIPTRIQVLSGLFRMLIALSAFMAMGGTTMVLECFKMIRYSKNDESEKLEDIISDKNLFKILKEYAQKEFSLENILLYENLQQFSHKKFTRTDLEEIEELFVRNYSKYEVNLPSLTKRKFYEYMKETEKSETLDVKLVKDLIFQEILNNIMDTFSRLQETEEYLKWERIKQFQLRKMSINPSNSNRNQ
ncbi:hypothetical protein NAEGRDRAFT_58957 [Naegleria gruberi]|uniref:RGS domain-containing protein n=1 Tax=Naegleria gruberi TaxID=5762 RepID=D2VQQ5_NAEGR|nr:uncharacterized protein NAEGRDRAFT_58957 [Naegleria gruberi]EFC40914.1 hypothetical protein NAEGRDRAFT_58957 [Naegleria gruberi]|eukprot:XP_002673658.1 hypothetical protein NAEGRDRAFT_58957 [Naegleria gruberi strain NEG-M]